ncbi:MAG: hypothetical protein K1X94_17500 [Sandaracinaceae bacterium]|nr:hypothetical protein [Sandaracinaceae bacterium]
MGHPRMLTPRILWFALFVSQFLYLGMLLMPGVVPPGQVPEPVLAYAIAPVALAAAVASFVVPRMLAQAAFAAGAALETRPMEGKVASAGYRSALGAREFADREEALRIAVQRGFAPFILRLALNESVALFGFVLGYLGHPLTVWLPFFVVSWTMMAFRFPTERGLLRPLAKANGIDP